MPEENLLRTPAFVRQDASVTTGDDGGARMPCPDRYQRDASMALPPASGIRSIALRARIARRSGPGLRRRTRQPGICDDLARRHRVRGPQLGERTQRQLVRALL